jgi:hypothetical protein
VEMYTIWIMSDLKALLPDPPPNIFHPGYMYYITWRLNLILLSRGEVWNWQLRLGFFRVILIFSFYMLRDMALKAAVF